MVMLSSASRIFFTEEPSPAVRRHGGRDSSRSIPSGGAPAAGGSFPRGRSATPRNDVLPHPIDDLLGRRPGREEGADPRLEQSGSVLVRDDAAAEHHDVV